jgi:hypothetical protein
VHFFPTTPKALLEVRVDLGIAPDSLHGSTDVLRRYSVDSVLVLPHLMAPTGERAESGDQTVGLSPPSRTWEPAYLELLARILNQLVLDWNWA